jgi:hypothetical protein
MLENHIEFGINHEEKAAHVAQTLIENSGERFYNPDNAIQKAIETSLQNGSPLRCRMVLCPSWTVQEVDGEKRRTVKEIPIREFEGGFEPVNPNERIVPFLTQEVPGLVSFLNRNGVNVQLLVVLADIFTDDWVFDKEQTDRNAQQNLQVINRLLKSGRDAEGKPVFSNKQQVELRVQSQKKLAGEVKFFEALSEYEKSCLQRLNFMSDWYDEVQDRLATMNEYADQRGRLSGLLKIQSRARFLAASYALDGTPEFFNQDFKKSRFTDTEVEQGYLALGSVASPHGDIIARGLNVVREQHKERLSRVGLVTPFNNALDHFWSEPSVPTNSY